VRWRVRITPGDPGEVVTADHYRLDAGGSLVLVNGDVFAQRLVRAYAPTSWHCVDPEPEPVAAPAPRVRSYP